MYESDVLIERVSITVYIEMDMQKTTSMSVHAPHC